MVEGNIRLTVILPTLDERDAIALVIAETLECVGDMCRILVVDDGSTDGTVEIVRELALTDSRITILERNAKDGLAPALATGVAAAQTEYVAWLDADGSMPPRVLADLWTEIQNGADISVGSRFVEGGGTKGSSPETRNFLSSWKVLRQSEDTILGVVLSSWLNIFLRRFLGDAVRDYTSGFILTRPEHVSLLGLSGRHGEYCISFLYQAIRSGLTVVEVPYIILPRMGGRSKTGSHLLEYLALGSPYIQTAFRLRFLESSNK